MEAGPGQRHIHVATELDVPSRGCKNTSIACAVLPLHFRCNIKHAGSQAIRRRRRWRGRVKHNVKTNDKG